MTEVRLGGNDPFHRVFVFWISVAILGWREVMLNRTAQLLLCVKILPYYSVIIFLIDFQSSICNDKQMYSSASLRHQYSVIKGSKNYLILGNYDLHLYLGMWFREAGLKLNMGRSYVSANVLICQNKVDSEILCLLKVYLYTAINLWVFESLCWKKNQD